VGVCLAAALVLVVVRGESILRARVQGSLLNRLAHEANPQEARRLLADHAGSLDLGFLGRVREALEAAWRRGDLTEAEYWAQVLSDASTVQRSRAFDSATATLLLDHGTRLFALRLQRAAAEVFETVAPLARRCQNLRVAGTALRLGGAIALERGDYARALALTDEAFDVFQGIGDQDNAAHLRLQQGRILNELGEYDKALSRTRDAAAHWQAVMPNHTPHRARATIEYANCLELQGQVLQAQGHAATAVSIKSQAARYFALGDDPVTRAKSLLITAELAMATRDWQSAIRYANDGITLCARPGMQTMTSSFLRLLGDAHRAGGDRGEARRAFARALANDTAFENSNQMHRDYVGLAQCAEMQNDQATALREYSAAIEAWHAFQRKEVMLGASAFVPEVPMDMYAGALRILVARNTAAAREQAFDVIQRAKKGVLTARLSGNWREAKLTADEQQQLERLRYRTTAANSPADQRDAQADLTSFWVLMAARHPEGGITTGAAPFNAARLGQFLPPDTLLVDYLVTPEQTFMCTAARGAANGTVALQAYSLPIAARDLAERVSRFRAACQGPDTQFKSLGGELRALLFGPFGGELTDRTRIVISPSGPLFDLPFQALPVGGTPLLAHAAVVYLPSASLMESLASRPKSSEAAIEQARHVLVVTPTGSADATAAGPAGSHGWTDFEAQQVGLKIAGSAVILRGREATEARFRDEAPRAAVIHIASHAFANSASPMYGGIVLTRPDDGSDDGILYAWELAGLQMHADLLILSACETAQGRVAAGEGVLGLTWAALVAGSRSVVVAQWPVDDWATALWMSHFHRNLTDGMSTAEAGRQAALAVAQFPGCSHPRFWAGFIVAGGW